MSIDIEKHRPLARLLLRLMGIYFVIEGAVGVISNGLDSYWGWRYAQRTSVEYFPEQSLAWTIGSVGLVMVGLYLTFGGKMAMDAVFHEKFDAPTVPCPRCGYDLRGSTGGNCPECGGAIDREESPAKSE